MGLDIYLYAKDEQAASDAHSEASNALCARPDYDELTEEQRKDEWAKLPPYPKRVEVPSIAYPDHFFNRRYLRSSYNSGGFNRAVPDMTGQEHDLYWIFEPVRGTGDSYEFEMTTGSIGALEESLKRATQVAQELRECDPLRVDSASSMQGAADHLWNQPPREAEVLQWYRAEKARRAGREKRDEHFSEGYSCAKGTVLGFTQGQEVLAVATGRDCLGGPAAIFIYRAPEARDDYIKCAEIVAEFCDEAMNLIRRDGAAFLHWSG